MFHAMFQWVKRYKFALSNTLFSWIIFNWAWSRIADEIKKWVPSQNVNSAALPPAIGLAVLQALVAWGLKLILVRYVFKEHPNIVVTQAAKPHPNITVTQASEGIGIASAPTSPRLKHRVAFIPVQRRKTDDGVQKPPSIELSHSSDQLVRPKPPEVSSRPQVQRKSRVLPPPPTLPVALVAPDLSLLDQSPRAEPYSTEPSPRADSSHGLPPPPPRLDVSPLNKVQMIIVNRGRANTEPPRPSVGITHRINLGYEALTKKPEGTVGEIQEGNPEEDGEEKKEKKAHSW